MKGCSRRRRGSRWCAALQWRRKKAKGEVAISCLERSDKLLPVRLAEIKVGKRKFYPIIWKICREPRRQSHGDVESRTFSSKRLSTPDSTRVHVYHISSLSCFLCHLVANGSRTNEYIQTDQESNVVPSTASSTSLRVTRTDNFRSAAPLPPTIDCPLILFLPDYPSAQFLRPPIAPNKMSAGKR